MIRVIQIALSIILTSQVWGQNGFEKLYILNDSSARIGNIRVTDSCYYFIGSGGNNYNSLYLRFGKLDLEGNIIEEHRYLDSNEYQFAGYQVDDNNKMNYRGNFIAVYGSYNWPNGYFSPRIVELNPNGQKVLDTIYSHFWEEDSILMGGEMGHQITSDSCVLVAFTIKINKTRTPLFPDYDKIGVMVLKVDRHGHIRWTRKYFNSIPNVYNFSYSFTSIRIKPDNSFVLSLREFNGRSTPSLYTNNNLFFNCDTLGFVISQDLCSLSQGAEGRSGFQSLPDQSSVFCYFDSRIQVVNMFVSAVYFNINIAKLNSQKQLVWTRPLNDIWASDILPCSGGLDLLVKQNNIYLTDYAGKFYGVDRFLGGMHFYKVSMEGNIVWDREFTPLYRDSTNDPLYTINDIDSTFDDGFLLAGYAEDWKDNVGGNPRSYAYFIKTNCLGFIGDPTASVSKTTDSLTSTFVNNSVMAGRFTWYFGDGDSLETTEYIDTVAHTYSNFGDYTVKLIAWGCDHNDTITFLNKIVNANAIPSDTIPQVFGDGTLITVFPNPSEIGSDIKIYAGNITEFSQLEIIDDVGKIIDAFQLPKAKMTYFVPTTDYAAGSYVVRLKSNNKVLETERLILISK